MHPREDEENAYSAPAEGLSEVNARGRNKLPRIIASLAVLLAIASMSLLSVEGANAATAEAAEALERAKAAAERAYAAKAAAVTSMQLFTIVAPGGAPLGMGLTSGNGGYAVIGDVKDNSTADKAGVSVGCRLVSVNGQSTEGLTTKEVENMLRGAAAQAQPRTLEFARA